MIIIQSFLLYENTEQKHAKHFITLTLGVNIISICKIVLGNFATFMWGRINRPHMWESNPDSSARESSSYSSLLPDQKAKSSFIKQVLKLGRVNRNDSSLSYTLERSGVRIT